MADPGVTTLSALREIYREPSAVARRKEFDKLDDFCRQFIARSPFVCIATTAADGTADCSPRGDPPGSVKVLDERTIMIPDRKGNNRLDTLTNVLANPGVGLLFLVPGIDETLRVIGHGEIVSDDAVLAPLAMSGRVPSSALKVTVQKVFFHCGKALIRARLWNPETRIDRDSFPTLGRILAEQTKSGTVEQAEARVAESYAKTLY
ncbi:MAG: pyridoxamine 5'-phosphate oxidase family protein [Rhodospirillales bacterium]|nr:pyridoxamine 5'-phosphate oxidase family protein [Rhodospirillales bacterium]